MNSIFFLILKWVMQSICLLGIGLLIVNQDVAAEDLVPIVEPEDLNARERQLFYPWIQPDLDFNVQLVSMQFELPTIGPLIPIQVTPLPEAVQTAAPAKEKANQVPLARYPEGNPKPQPNLKTEFPVLRPTNSVPLLEPAGEIGAKNERLGEGTNGIELIQEPNRVTESQVPVPAETAPAEITPEEIGPAEIGSAEIEPTETGSVQIGPAENVPAEIAPLEIAPLEIAPLEIAPLEIAPAEIAPAEIAPVKIGPAESTPPEIAPMEITPALIVPAQPPLAASDNSATDVPTDSPAGEPATDNDDTAPHHQTRRHDPFIDEVAPAEDFPRHAPIPDVPPAPESAAYQSIVPEYQGMNGCNDCCFRPEYYFLFEGVLLDRQGGPLTLSKNFSIDPFDYQLGGRFTYRSRPAYDRGVEISYVGLFNWDETATRDSAAGTLNSTFVPGAGLTAANFSAFTDATYQRQRFESSLHSVEYQNVKWAGDAAAFTAGLRYVLLQDEFQFDSLNLGGQRGQFNLDTTNNLIGPQVGVNLVHDVGYGLSFSLKGKLGLMANINNSETRLDNDGFLVANDDDNVNFSALFEVGLLAHYQISRSCRIRAGYEAWLITGMATVEDNLGTTISRSTGSNVNSGDDVFLNGFTVGLEFYY